MDVYMLVWGIIVFMLIVAVGLAAALLSMEGKYTAAIHSYLGKDVVHVIEKDFLVRTLL